MENVKRKKNAMRKITALFLLPLLLSCEPDVHPKEVADVYTTIKRHVPETTLTPDSVRAYILKRGSEPCLYDYNVDGVINTADLIRLLDSKPTGSEITQFLPVYGDEYVIDIVPAWNNYIQDFNCNLGWDVVVRRQCAGSVSNYPLFDSLEWVSEGQVLSTNREKLDFQNYDAEGLPLKECAGWQPPCNGINNVGMRVYCNGFLFYREADGWVRTNNFPDTIPVCGSPVEVPFLFGSDFFPYEFLVE